MVRLDQAVLADLRSRGAPKASLKEAQRLIRAGNVLLAGSVTREPKMQFVPGVEPVTLAACGTPLSLGEHMFYIMHKPVGYVCQRHPREPNVYDLIPEHLRRHDLGCVGRLDRDTTGTLLLCTDGGVQSLLLHPSSRVWKTYTAELDPSQGRLIPDAEARFRAGMTLDDGTRCAPATLETLSLDGLQVRVTVHEGFFHQVKRMLAHCGGLVRQLHRDRFGLLRVGGGTEGDGCCCEGVGTLQSGSSAQLAPGAMHAAPVAPGAMHAAPVAPGAMHAAPVAPGAMRALTTDELHLLVAMLPVDRCAKRALEGLRRGEAEAVEAEAVEAEAVEAEAVEAEAVDEEQSAAEVRTAPLELGVDSSAACTITPKRRLEETREDGEVTNGNAPEPRLAGLGRGSWPRGGDI